jgi:hypothetical protein
LDADLDAKGVGVLLESREADIFSVVLDSGDGRLLRAELSSDCLYGVPSLSVLDGWWIEGCIEGVTGWAIGERCDTANTGDDRSDCDASLNSARNIVRFLH